MTGVHTRIEGQVGRITLDRPKALNALNHDMSLAIEAALDAWATDDTVKMLVIDAAGDRAFCAGGDIADVYHAGVNGDYALGRDFWRDEYRMNAKMFRFPKPVASFMQGFVMGGGVGVGCHGSHRIVGDTSQVAMPETGIGLIPDVGGTLILSRAPGRIGEYLGATGGRIGAADAIFAGFSDYYLPESGWPALIETLCETGDWTAIDRAAKPAPDSALEAQRGTIDMLFAGETLRDILITLQEDGSEFAQKSLKTLQRVCPLSAACTVEMVHRIRGSDSIEKALELEFRFTYRSMDKGDFLEGVRAQIIDKDRNPKWSHASPQDVSAVQMSNMLLPLGAEALKLEEQKE